MSPGSKRGDARKLAIRSFEGRAEILTSRFE
jgi:hypothetical protein